MKRYLLASALLLASIFLPSCSSEPVTTTTTQTHTVRQVPAATTTTVHETTY